MRRPVLNALSPADAAHGTSVQQLGGGGEGNARHPSLSEPSAALWYNAASFNRSANDKPVCADRLRRRRSTGEWSSVVVNSDFREIEIKLYAPNLDDIRARLLAAGAVLAHPRVYERNIRYDNADGTLVGSGTIIRLRQDSRARLTYKEPGITLESGLYARYEAEVEVGDFETMNTILLKLGFVPSMIYEKYRTTYHLDEAEIVLDEMPYGTFIEIEGDEAAIQRAMVRLGVEALPRFNAGYAALFENVRKNLGLTFRDLTFDNFSEILVPEQAFNPANP